MCGDTVTGASRRGLRQRVAVVVRRETCGYWSRAVVKSGGGERGRDFLSVSSSRVCYSRARVLNLLPVSFRSVFPRTLFSNVRFTNNNHVIGTFRRRHFATTMTPKISAAHKTRPFYHRACKQ